MTTIAAIFILSVAAALVLTPVAARVGCRYGIVDRPSGRKVHTAPVPRVGGVALYVAFLVPFLCAEFYTTDVLALIGREPSVPWLFAGATLVFATGLTDDVRRLPPSVKFAAQAAAGLLAFAGGIRITGVYLPWGHSLILGWMSLPVTVFWFLLVINAVNLIDGLDGLAAGTSLFASLVLLALSLMGGRYLVAMGLAALAGACLGFLRYNFNPASIFMGDGGSYFLGYMLAALSVLGSIKGQATVAILIPVIALGMPLMDTIMAPIRRFILGRALFQPDRSHIHHKLLEKGLTQRRAVLVLYGATIFLGVVALLSVNAKDERAGLILTVLAACIIFGIRKLGYLEYVAMDKVIGYIRDVTDEMGLHRERRSFLERQIAINEARSGEEMWERVVAALELLKVDFAEMRLNGDGKGCAYRWCAGEVDGAGDGVLSLEMPLLEDGKSYGTLHLKKDMVRDPVSHYTLRRIEHLRRSIVRKLKAFENGGTGRG